MSDVGGKYLPRTTDMHLVSQYVSTGSSLVAQWLKNPSAMHDTKVWPLGWEDPLEEGMAIYSSILAWIIPEEPGGLVHRVTQSQTWVKWLNTHTLVVCSKNDLMTDSLKADFLQSSIKSFYNWLQGQSWYSTEATDQPKGLLSSWEPGLDLRLLPHQPKGGTGIPLTLEYWGGQNRDEGQGLVLSECYTQRFELHSFIILGGEW